MGARNGRRLATIAVSGGSCLLAACVAGCSVDDGLPAETLQPLYPVSEVTISHESTQEISVFSPDTEGRWPVVHLFPGSSGNRKDLSELARTLSGQGVVVFVPDYDSSSLGGTGPRAKSDLVCAWRFGNSLAAQYGGDLTQPVTVAGHSAGAGLALTYGLRGDGSPDIPCLTAAPDPDVVVAIAPCFGQPRDLSDWSNTDAHVVFVSGSLDKMCPSSSAERGAEDLRSAGFQVTFIQVDGGTHFNLVFMKDATGGQPVTSPYLPGSPAGVEVVGALLDAIEAGRSGDGSTPGP
jgi:dienelactone hydrolase